jgi:hypothetical protein
MLMDHGMLAGDKSVFPHRVRSRQEIKLIEAGSVEVNGDFSQLREAGQRNRAAVCQDLARPASRGDPLPG